MNLAPSESISIFLNHVKHALLEGGYVLIVNLLIDFGVLINALYLGLVAIHFIKNRLF